MLISDRRSQNLYTHQPSCMVRAAGGPPFSITHIWRGRFYCIKVQYIRHSKQMHYPPSRPTCTAAVIATKRQRWRHRNTVSSWGESEVPTAYQIWGGLQEIEMGVSSGGKRIERANKKDENVMEIQTWIHCGDRLQVRLMCGTSNEGTGRGGVQAEE